MVDAVHGIVGPAPLEFISRTLNRWTNHMVPVWNRYMPKVRGSTVWGLRVDPLWKCVQHVYIMTVFREQRGV